MPIPPSQYQFRTGEEYQQWDICYDCLIPLADALQYRVETWQRPPKDEEDDSRSDYEEILKRRFYEAFGRPLDDDLKRFNFDRALIWLQLNAPSAAVETQRRLDALQDALDPNQCSRDPESTIVSLADTAWYFHQLAEQLQPITRPKNGEGNGGTAAVHETARSKLPSNRKLKPCELKAYMQYKKAIEQNPKLCSAIDKEVYNWVKDNVLDEGEKLPSFATWQRQLRTVRKHNGDQKNESRIARPHGKSIVMEGEI